MCTMAAGYCLAAQGVYSSVSIPAYLFTLKWQLFFGIVFMASVIWFVVYFTNWTSPTSAFVLSIWAFGLVTMNLILPSGILLDKVHLFDRLRLPWGEQIAFPNTELGLGTIVLWLFSLSVYLYVLFGSHRLWRAGRHRAAIVLAANVLFFICAGVVDTLIDLRRIRWVYVAEFRFLLCVVSMFVYTYKNREAPI